MTYRRIILAVLAIADVVARLVLGLPQAFGVMALVALVGIPLSLAFLAADCVPMRRWHAVASGAALVGLPLALLIPTWGWMLTAAAGVAQAFPWAMTARRN